MKERIPVSEPPELPEVLALMRQALQLLDRTGAPSDIGAHLDLAIIRFDQWRSKTVPSVDHRGARV